MFAKKRTFPTKRLFSLWTISRLIMQEMSCNYLKTNGMLVVFLPVKTTDHLQPLDLSINIAAKDFLRDKFRRWYTEEVSKNLKNEPEYKNIPVDMQARVMKELGA